MSVRSLDDLIESAGVRGRRVFVRADLNVPMDAGRIRDDTRIRASLPTLQRLRDAGARIVLASHLGRPRGQRQTDLSLAPVADALAELIAAPVRFCDECTGPRALEAARALSDGEILLLENLRFDAREEQNDPGFAAELASLAEIYVNDAFGTAHRAHASTVGLVPLLEDSAAGLLLASELAQLQIVLTPERPLLCLLGGAKVSDKLGVLEALAPHADVLAIGGAMAYTFLAARGEPTGASLVEPDRVDAARRVVGASDRAGNRLLLPLDHVVAQTVAADAASRIVDTIPSGWMGLDIGPATSAAYAAEARAASTILWNGPLGVFELPPFASGTEVVARAVAESPGTSIVGGGDTVAAINQLGLADEIDHLSTGGGASLAYVQGLELPGLVALSRRGCTRAEANA